MQDTLRRVRGERDSGFTLIEMLVVVVIIGVLVAIAIPMYSNYRKGAENKSAESDVRGAISAVEQFYTDNGNQYPANVTGTVGTKLTFAAIGPNGTAQTANVSANNTLYYRNNATYYVICGQNSSGGTVWLYNSSTTQSVQKSSQATLNACANTGT
jgi:type IV pilus assembly protein PilA